MKVTSAALRLRASMPTAPVPAKTSRKREPTTPGPRTLKSVSRRRSLVGRSVRPFRLFRTRLRYLPAMIRIEEKTNIIERQLTESNRTRNEENEVPNLDCQPEELLHARTFRCNPDVSTL